MKHTDVCIVHVSSVGVFGMKLVLKQICALRLGLQSVIRVQLWLALVSNTAERVEEFTSDIEEILQSGQLPKKDAERLRG